MSALDTLSHWRLARDPDGLAWLTFDRAASAVNALSADTMAELALVLDALDKDPPKGLVIRSGKPTGFIVGADVNEFASLDTPEQGRALVARGWNLFNRLAAVRYPTLAPDPGPLPVAAWSWRWPAAIASWRTSPAYRWRCPRSCWASSPAGAACCGCRA